MLEEEKVKEIRKAFDEVIAPDYCDWVFNEYGLKLDHDEVMGAIKVLDAILQSSEKYERIDGTLTV